MASAVATDTVETVFPTFGARMISALVCISALGAINGLVFTGARISYAVGADHRTFGLLGRWSPATGTPIPALALQGALSLVLIVALGSFMGALLYTTPVVYLFYLATSFAVIVLRRKEPKVHRPYRVTAYPLPIIVFFGTCVFLIYSAVMYKPKVAAIAFGILLAGLPIYWFSRRKPRDSGA